MSASADLRAFVEAATPGPWVVEDDSRIVGSDRIAVKNEQDFDWVATCQVSNVSEFRDNARLIALAPDLAAWAADAADALGDVNHELRRDLLARLAEIVGEDT